MQDEKMVNEQDEQATVADNDTVEQQQDDQGEQVTAEGTTSDEQGDTFPRAYVEKLRGENATYRERAKQSDELARRLHTALVALDGRLADPEDLPYSEAHLEDPEALGAAVAELVERKPGLKARQVTGDVGAGNRGAASGTPADLISLIRGL